MRTRYVKVHSPLVYLIELRYFNVGVIRTKYWGILRLGDNLWLVVKALVSVVSPWLDLLNPYAEAGKCY